MGHPNEELLRKGYDAFDRGDLDAVIDLFADDIQWHIPGRNLLSGDYKGRDQVGSFFAKLMEASGNTFRIEVREILGKDKHGVALITERAKRNGKSLETKPVHVFHIRGDKVTDFWFHPDDQYELDEFWS